MGGGGLGYLRQAATADSRPFDRRTLVRLLTYVRPYRRHLVLALAVAVGGSAMTVLAPYLLKVGIDRGILARAPRVVLLTAGLYLGTRVLAAVFSAIQTVQVNRLGNGAVYDLRERLFTKLMDLGLHFFDQQPVGVLVSNGTNDVTALSNLVSSGIVSIITDGVTLAGIIGIMLVISPLLALASFAVMPVLVLVTRAFQGRAVRAYRNVRTRIGQLTAEFEEGISGVRVTQAFAREGENARRFVAVNRANVDANMDAAVVNSLFNPAVNMVSALGTIVVLWFGGTLVLHQAVTIGTLVAFVNYLSRFFQPIQDLTQQYNTVQQAMAAAEKIFGVLDVPLEVCDRADAVTMPPLTGQVRFRDVSFAYVPGRQAVSHLDFQLAPGTRAALVGPTGAGKSTVAALLLRFYDPDEGAVEVDGIDLRRVTQASYRRQTAIVLQEPVLFSTSILENIRYGRLEATQEEVEAAAAAVGADRFIRRLPQGYLTPVGERGTRLAQGEKQLLSFARALLAAPRILVLDEATASVDLESEHQVQQAMQTLLAGRTSLIIAHRLSTVRDADVILVLDQGRLAERGTHAELLAAGGIYAALYRRQFARLDAVEA
jgi:ABC-type multidrug transport system fused ATPase/permease subunit